MGSVPQLRLKTCHYQDGEEGAKGLVTSFFHLLDLEGEKKGLKQGQEGNSPSQACCPHPPDSPGGSPSTTLPTCVPRPHSQPLQPQRQTAQRPASAAPS